MPLPIFLLLKNNRSRYHETMSSRKQPQIQRIYIDSNVRDLSLTLQILKKLPGVPTVIVADKARFLEEATHLSLREGKMSLWLTRFEGPFLKPCPATGRDYLCCQYRIINTQTHCPLECSYCILQHYLNNPLLTVYVNRESALKEIDSLIASYPKRLFRMGTGELTDSLALDSITHANEDLIRAVSGKKVILEIKTKTNRIRHLPKISRGNVVVSWSLNPNAFIRTEELKSASLEERLEAAKQVIKRGYRLGFHFDPLLMLPGWEKSYDALVNKLTKEVPEKEVLWISLGSLRFPPALKKTIQTRFPKSLITAAELVKGLDGKMRYFRPQRTVLYRQIYKALRKNWKDVFIYFCMENKTLWQDIMGFAPDHNGHLDYLFHENLARRFPDLALPTPHRQNYPAEN